jgi:short subunit dehydrogenase-like uncharacterized protein
MRRRFDVIVFGATGYTGRLVAEHLHARYGVGRSVVWAIAGRDRARLTAVREWVGASAKLPLFVADASDAASLASLVPQSKVLLSAVGPYQLYGEPLVRACASSGTDYVDLCGEPVWMARMIAALDAPARASGARIVFSCGFDSIPFDLGVVFLQDAARRRFGAPLTRVRGRVRVMTGGFSGGTVASALATIEQIGRDARSARVMADPFALTPGFCGPDQPEGESAAYDDAARSWTGPFVMSAINTKNVHRTNALCGHPWGRDFVYDERMLTGDGERGERRAKALACRTRVQSALLDYGLARALLRRFVLPKPGQGPSREERLRGRYELLFIGDTARGQRLRATVTGEGDPGYGSTCKLVAESALCLAREIKRETTGGGVWTPGAAMGLPLVRRLQERAGLAFAIEE